MKDNISLIAAATGGFMLSVALSGLLKGQPITNWQRTHYYGSNNYSKIAKVQVIKHYSIR